MQIRDITLTNIRRFTDPVHITGIGPGVNVLAAPNEAGKSTIFDALHAAFFFSHRSFGKEQQALVPRAGGDPEVTVSFDTQDAAWRLSKVWSKSGARKSARLWRDGVLVAQGEEAETLLADVIAAPGDGGPAGLLWVRQGVVELDADKAARQTETAARRGILEQVAGEVEAMTGGRHMAQAIAACDAVLGAHLSPTGRVKAGGGLAEADAEVATLTGERDRLAGQVAALQEDLDHRRRATRELAEVSDPEAETERQARLSAAQQALTQAEARQSQIQLAEGRLRELEARQARLDQGLVQLDASLKEHRNAQTALAEIQVKADQAEAALHTARPARVAAQAHLVSVQTRAKAATEQAKHARAAQMAQAAAAQRDELQGRVAKAETLRSQIEALEAERARAMSDQQLRALIRLEEAQTLARRSRDAAAPSVILSYDGAAKGRVHRDGAVVPGDTAIPVPDGATFQIEGIGRLQIAPGAAGSDDEVAQTEAALARALIQAGQPDMAAARTAARQGQILDDRLRDLRADLAALAPDGLGPLRDRLAALPPALPADPDLPPVAQAEAEEEAAREAVQSAMEALRAAETRSAAAETAAAHAQTARTAAAERLTRATEALPERPEAELTRLTEDRAKLVDAGEAARTARAALTAEGPDLAACKAAAARAASIVDNARRAVGQLRETLAQVNARIAMSASAAPEEDLALVTDRLTAAEARRDVIRFELDVNRKLRAVLTQAQSQARDAYVRPIHAELAPLLRMLWPDAEPVIDADTGAITALARRAVEEEVQGLSGGTREQISLLVRLAFAQLLAKRGTPAPVILDDAIVYTDDDRIEQIFDALAGGTESLQVIVLSCRQRAFRSLGGRALTIAPVPKA